MRSPSFAGSFAVYGIFAASGASALIYQIIWARWLSLLFGSTTPAVSIVLGCFMAGLALGSWAAGRLLPRIGDPMKAYALAELGVGIFALLFPHVFRLADGAFTLLVRPDSPPIIALPVRAFLSFLILSVPTTLMGATLPLLTDHFRRNPRRTESWKVGVLYAVNTFGAALGIVAATFVLIERVGVSATTVIAAFLNFAVAAIGYACSRRGRDATAGPGAPAERAGAEDPGFTGTLAVGVLAASGAVALASEVLWTRTLESLIGNSSYAFATIVLVYLVGIAVGSWLFALVVRRLRRLPLWLAGLQIAMGCWVLVSIALFKAMAAGIAASQMQMVPVSVIFRNYLKAMGILFPLAALSGACFPVATRMLEPGSAEPHGRSVARAYAWNTMGALAGAIVAGFIVAPRFDFLAALYLLASAYGVTALAAPAAIAWESRRSPRAALPAAVPAAAVAIALAALGGIGATGEGDFRRHLESKDPYRDILFHRPGLQGVTTAYRYRHQARSDGLLVNGIGMTVKATDTKMMAHLPLMLHPDPADTLVVCFGMGTTFRSAMSHGGRVTAIELVKEVYDAFGCFYDDAPQLKANPRGRMVVNDGRNFLKLSREKFDVITVDPPPPIDAAGVNHLYSREFIELAKTRLKKGGIMAHWYPYPGSRSGVDDRATYLALVKTFVTSFPFAYAKPGYNRVGMHLLGSSEPLSVDRGLIGKRLADAAIAWDVGEWDRVPQEFFLDLPKVGNPLAASPILTDDNPFLEFYLLRTLRTGEKKMFPASHW